MKDYLDTETGEEGFSVEAVVDPPSPLIPVHEHRPALIVLNVEPHGARGLEALDALRTDDTAREIPVLVITSHREIAEAALASYNVRASLAKPFDPG